MRKVSTVKKKDLKFVCIFELRCLLKKKRCSAASNIMLHDVQNSVLAEKPGLL